MDKDRKAKERKGAFVPVLVYISSTDTFRLHRHPVILLPSSPFFCLLGADRCLRKNTESTIDRRHRESFLGCRHVRESLRANVTGWGPDAMKRACKKEKVTARNYERERIDTKAILNRDWIAFLRSEFRGAALDLGWF